MKRKFLQFGNNAPKIESRRMGMTASDSHRKAAYKTDGDDDDDDDDDDEPVNKNSGTAAIIKKMKAMGKRLDEASKVANQSEQKAMDAIASAKTTLEETIKEVKVVADEADKRIKAIDKKLKDGTAGNSDGKKTFGAAYREAIKEKAAELEDQHMKSGQFSTSVKLKDVGVMTTATHLVGQGVTSYNPTPTLKPSQAYRMRDFLPTTPSPTGIYSGYAETGGSGDPAWQNTEGTTKAKMDIVFTENKTISKPLAATIDFGRLMLKNAPFLENTLPRIMLRKFFKVESAAFVNQFKTTVQGGGSSSESNKVKRIIDYIASLRDADYGSGFILLSNTTLGMLNKAMIDAGAGFQGLGGIVSNPDGSMSVSNTTIQPVSFMPNNEVFCLDPDYAERVETEAITIEFSAHNKDNFEKNTITARIECFEALNILDPYAHAWKTLS